MIVTSVLTTTFNVTSGNIRVTDPCYEPDTWCAGEFPALNGKWHAAVVHTKEDGTENLERRLRFIDWLSHEYDAAIERYKATGVTEEALESFREFLQENHDEQIKNHDERYEAGNPDVIVICHESSEGLFTLPVKGDLLSEDGTIFGYNTKDYVLLDIDVGVDSGQVGFFDSEEYVKVNADKEIADKFYDDVCSQSLIRNLESRGLDAFGIASMGFGISSCTNFGDGSYSCRAVLDKDGKVVFAFVDTGFNIPEYRDDEDDEDDY